METITRIISPQEDGATVRHILKAELHFSTHAVARLTRAERGILVNGRRARTVDLRPVCSPFPVTGPSPLSGRTAICWWWTSPPG